MHVAYVCPFKTLQKSAIKFLIISNTSVCLLFLMYFSTSPLPKKSNKVPKAKRSTPNFSWPHPLPGLIHPIGTSWASNSVSPVKSMHTSTGSQAWTGFKNLWWYLPLIGHNGIYIYMFNDMHLDSPVPTNSKKSNMIGHFAWNPESATPSLDSDERNLQQNPLSKQLHPEI